MRPLGQEQIGLHLVEELKGLAGVALQGAGAAPRMGFDAEALQAGQDRGLLGIVAEVVEMHHHVVACLHKPLTEADQPGGDAADVCAAAVVGEGDLHLIDLLIHERKKNQA